MTKSYKLTAANITTIKTNLETDATLSSALGNHRANFYTDLTKIFQASGVDMDAFKTALENGLNVYFGKPTEATRKAKRTEAPQVIKDWSGRVKQTVALGIRPAVIASMSEGEMKKEIALTTAAKQQGVTRAAIVKAAGGAKAPLKAVEKAVKAATIKANPNAETERKAVVAVMAAVKNSLDGLDHAARMAYLTSLVTYAKANPTVAAARTGS